MSNQQDNNDPALDEEEWFEARGAYKAALKIARQWQSDARTALVEAGEYPPAHVNENGEWEVQFWSPGARKGLLVFLNSQLEALRQQEWGAFYQEMAQKVGAEILGPQGFEYVPEISQPGPDGLSFVFRRPSPSYPNQHDFIDLQISTSVMLTPPPRRFTINLVRNNGDRPMFGQFGGYESRLSVLLPDSKPDFWWSFKTEAEYEERLREAFKAVVQHGLAAMM
jgi:hypothetical protein